MRALALVLVLVSSSAAAQSKRYPPEPVDKDREKAEHSALWENATNPSSEPYKALVAEARQAIASRTDDQLLVAVTKLDRAIALLPQESEAYELRGDAFMQLRRWEQCAADLQVAAATQPRTEGSDRKPNIEQRRKLGLCLARANKLADAERVLAEAAATGSSTGEMLMRLGEVRIAMGKLDEAISALSAALDASDLPSQSLTRWLLASAYDRARRPADAISEARRAAGYDRSFTALTNNNIPLLGAGESEYLLGLAWEYNDPPRPENALIYFRKFIKIAPDSPWRRRADDHLRELKNAALPEALDRRGGGAPLDETAARTIVRKQMPKMRACMTNLPSSVMEVTITKSGPRTKTDKPARPDPFASPRSRYKPTPVMAPPDGVSVVLSLSVDGTARAETDAAARCIEPIAQKLALPAVKEKDGWYKLSFLVVAP